MRINVQAINSSVSQQHSSRLASPSLAKDAGKVNSDSKNKKDAGNSLQTALNSIQERRQKILDTRNELMAKTLENGDDIKTIQEPLKMYAEQLKNLDKEAKNLISREAERLAEATKKEKEEPVKVEKVEHPKTEEELLTEKTNQTLSNMTNISKRFDSFEGNLSMVENMESRAKVLESEIKLDGQRREDFVAKVMSSGGYVGRGQGVTVELDNSAEGLSSKERELLELNEKIQTITKDTATQINETTEQLNDNIKPENEQSQEETL